MNTILMAASLILASVTIVSPLAGALEVPGDVQLSRERYLAVRGIYYPGLTVAGVAEPLAIVVIGFLLASVSPAMPSFWLVALALAAEALAHLLYWLLIVPMNGVWMTGESLRATPVPGIDAADRSALQDRWERSHIYRAVASTAAFALLVAATLAPLG
jgi:Domain of unknown function (DUF1772)